MRFFRRNLLSTYAVYGTAAVSGLVVTPVLVRELGAAGFGVWSVISSVMLYLSLLDLGVTASVIRFAAENRGRSDEQATSRLASTAVFVYSVIGLVALVLVAAAAWLLPFAVDIPEGLVQSARVATALLGVAYALRFPLNLFASLLAAQQRYDVLNGASTLANVLYSGLVVAVLGLSDVDPLVAVAAIAAGTTVLRLVLHLPWVSRELPALRLRRAYVDRRGLRSLLAVSGDTFLIHLSGRVVFTADVIIVGILLGPVPAAVYAVPARLFSVAYNAGTAGTNLLYPAFAELEGAEERERQARYLYAGLRGGMAAMLLFALPLVLIPDLLIEAWVGRGFEESVPVAVLLGLALLAHQPAHLMSQYLVARGFQRRIAVVFIAKVVVNVALSVVLALTVGLWAVALSTLVTELVAGWAVVPRLTARASGRTVDDVARALLRPFFPATVVAAIVLVALPRLTASDSWAALAVTGALWVGVLSVATWFAGISAAERAALRARVLPRRSAPLPD